MLSAEMFKKIGESSCGEEKELLCNLNGISFEEFERLWPLEKFGRDILDSKIILVQTEFQDFHDPFRAKVSIWWYSNINFLISSTGANYTEIRMADVTPSLSRALKIYMNFNIRENPWLREK